MTGAAYALGSETPRSPERLRLCLKAAKPRPVHLDSAEQIALVLEAAGHLDRGEAVIGVSDRHGRTWTQRPAVQTTGRRAAIADARRRAGVGDRRDGLARRRPRNGRFEVGRDKTDAGMREVDMLPLLREILTEHKAASKKTGPDDPCS